MIICPNEVLQFLPRLLELVLPSVSYSEEKLMTRAQEVNESLLAIVKSPSFPEFDEKEEGENAEALKPKRERNKDKVAEKAEYTSPVNVADTLEVITQQLNASYETSRLAALEWLITIHHRVPSQVRRPISTINT